MNDHHNMEYNSEKEDVIIPEYGRNVQMLIQHAKTIEDPAYRQALIEKVIDLMHQMHPQNRNIEDYREKLWKHVFLIADYDLDVTPPAGDKPTEQDRYKRPDAVPYPAGAAKHRHYGYNVQKLIKKAMVMEPGPVRQGFVTAIASYMKLAYRTWNREHYISDEIIKNDLRTLSNGELALDEGTFLDNLANSSYDNKNNSNGYNNSKRGGHKKRGGRDHGSHKNRNKGGNGGKRRKMK